MPRPGSHPAIPVHRRAADRAQDTSPAADDLRAAAFAGAPVGLGILDSTARLIEANLAFQELLSSRAVPGEQLTDLVVADSAKAVTGVLAALRSGKPGQRVCIHAVAAASRQPVVLTLTPLTQPS